MEDDSLTPLLVIFTLEYTQVTHTSKQIISHIYTQTDVQNYKTTDICRMYTVHIIKKYNRVYLQYCADVLSHLSFLRILLRNWWIYLLKYVQQSLYNYNKLKSQYLVWPHKTIPHRFMDVEVQALGRPVATDIQSFFSDVTYPCFLSLVCLVVF